MDNASRREDLEIKIAHLERGLQELSDVVVRQQQQLENLTARGDQLLQRLASLQSDAAEDGATREERPPHY